MQASSRIWDRGKTKVFFLIRIWEARFWNKVPYVCLKGTETTDRIMKKDSRERKADYSRKRHTASPTTTAATGVKF